MDLKRLDSIRASITEVLPRLADEPGFDHNLFTEQLTVLDQQMKEVIANVARGDAEALLANGQFLEAKFRERDFLNP